jgi:cytoskeletal protein CcmA (bactofilin family)
MFKNNDEDYSERNAATEDTVIGNAIKVEGDLNSSGNIIILGEVAGKISTEKFLKVGEKAKIVADVFANEAFISGKLQGNISVKNKLELANTAEINGDIQAATLIISAGAVFNGKCSMSAAASVQSNQEDVEDNEDEEE